MPHEEENVEQPIQELERRIEELTGIPGSEERAPEVERLRQELQDLRGEIYSGLSAWQKTQVARHAKRPYTLDYVQMLFGNLVEIHGDRKFADDPVWVDVVRTASPLLVAMNPKGLLYWIVRGSAFGGVSGGAVSFSIVG